MFSSKTPRGLTRGLRPGDDHLPHNKPNLVLIEFREELRYRDLTSSELAREWLSNGSLSRSLWGFSAETFAQIDHARSVLIGIAHLAPGGSNA